MPIGAFVPEDSICQKARDRLAAFSARDEVFDRIVGLELGADDYVTKPFEPRELYARIKSVLRRTQQLQVIPTESERAGNKLQFSGFTLDLTARTLAQSKTGKEIKLTSTEFSLLKALAENPNTVLSRAKILDLVDGASTYLTDRVIDAHIARLRRKMEKSEPDAVVIKTVHGTGYILATELSRA